MPDDSGTHDADSACPDELLLARFSEGRLNEAARRQIERHLDGCASCLEIVGVAAAGADPLDATRPTTGPPTEQPAVPGSVSSRYRIVEELGRGAMGVVYRAYDPKLHREVALKVLLEQVVGDTRTRMVREARSLAKLSHPNVVAIYDVDVRPSDVTIAMEYVPGDSLRGWLDAKSRSPAEILEAFEQAGRGLAAAHAHGLIHRDFKPANVLVTESEAEPLRVKVADFGLAKPAEPSPEDRGGDLVRSDADDRRSAPRLGSGSGSVSDGTTWADSGRLTQTGAVVGTPRYMPPEQHAQRTLTPAVDQYAYCVALWEALAGEPPFTGASIAELYSEKKRVAPTWPDSVPVARRVRDALRRGLSPRPTDRWPSMDALVRRISPRAAARRRTIAVRGGVTIAALLATTGLLLDARLERQRACQNIAQELDDVWGEPQEAALGSGPALEHLDAYAQRWLDHRRRACEAFAVRGDESATAHELRLACLRRGRVALETAAALLSEDPSARRSPQRVVDGLPDPERCDDVGALLTRSQGSAPRERVTDGLEIVDQARISVLAGRPARARALLDRSEAVLEVLQDSPERSELALLRAQIHREFEETTEAFEQGRVALQSALDGRRPEQAREAAEFLAGLSERAGRAVDAEQYRFVAQSLNPPDSG